MICRADEHYRVVRRDGRDVTALTCMQCDYAVTRDSVSSRNAPGYAGQTACGLPRYNRMRARMVAHIHAMHREIAP